MAANTAYRARLKYTPISQGSGVFCRKSAEAGERGADLDGCIRGGSETAELHDYVRNRLQVRRAGTARMDEIRRA